MQTSFHSIPRTIVTNNPPPATFGLLSPTLARDDTKQRDTNEIAANDNDNESTASYKPKRQPTSQVPKGS